MSRATRKRWLTVAAAVVALIAPTVVVASTMSDATPRHNGPAGAVTAATQTGRIGAARHTTLQSSAKAYTPTKAQLADRAKAMAGLAKHAAPSMGTHTTRADVRTNGGPQTSGLVSQAPGDYKRFRSSQINSTCSGCAQSQVNEPSVANNGKYIVETSNWNIAYAVNGGASTITWQNQNPYALSAGFCCDQQVTYDPERNIFLLLQLDYAGEGAATNGLALSIASGKTPTSWCTYKFSGAIGGGATDTPDYPKIAIANGNAYVTWNDYPPNAGFARSGLARFPLDSLMSCAGFSYNFLTRTTEFTFALATAGSALDTFYWVSNWFLDGTTNGSNLRIFAWPENSGSYTATTRAINAFNFSTVACGSPDWCSRLDPRYETAVITRAEYRGQANAAFAGDTILEVTGTAGPSGFSGGKNYVLYNYFKLNSLTYIGNDQTFSTGTNFAYGACAVNSEGYVGCAMQTGTNAPGGLVLVQDAASPTQPWAYDFAVGAVGGASAGGDYVVVSPWNPGVGPFQTVLWRVSNTGTTLPYYIVWGRDRETSAYTRWKNT